MSLDRFVDGSRCALHLVLNEIYIIAFLQLSSLAAKRIKYLLVNPMNNTAGLSLTMGLSLGHMDVYCLSNFSEENLLASIDRYQVSTFFNIENLINKITLQFVLLILANGFESVPRPYRLAVSIPGFTKI